MSFRPHQSDNAIVRVLFACECVRPLNETEFRAIHARHEEFADLLPRGILNEQMGFAIQGTGQPTPTRQVVGTTWQGYARDGALERTFQAHGNFITFADQKYTRWNSVWGMARRTFGATLSAVPSIEIATFGLEYLDRFTSPAEEGPRVDGLLNPSSIYIVPAAFQAPDLWHSHHGSLRESLTASPPHTENENVNLDLLREGGGVSNQYALQITIRHRSILQRAVPAALAMGLVDEFMNKMHERDKVVMRDLLTAEAADEIHLGEMP